MGGWDARICKLCREQLSNLCKAILYTAARVLVARLVIKLQVSVDVSMLCAIEIGQRGFQRSEDLQEHAVIRLRSGAGVGRVFHV